MWSNHFRYDFIRLSHWCGGILTHFFATLIQVIEACGHLFMPMRSGLWLDYCNTLILLLIIVLLHGPVLAILTYLTPEHFGTQRSLWSIQWLQFLRLQNNPKSSPPPPHGQTSSLWSRLSRGHCCRSLVVCWDATMQTNPCCQDLFRKKRLSPGNPSKQASLVQSFSDCTVTNFSI